MQIPTQASLQPGAPSIGLPESGSINLGGNGGCGPTPGFGGFDPCATPDPGLITSDPGGDSDRGDSDKGPGRFDFDVGRINLNNTVNILDRIISNNFRVSLDDGLGLLTEALGAFGVLDPKKTRKVLNDQIPSPPSPYPASTGSAQGAPTTLEQAQRSGEDNAPLLPEISPAAISFNQRRIDALAAQIPRQIMNSTLSEAGQQELLTQAQTFSQSSIQSAGGVESLASFTEQSAASAELAKQLAADSETLSQQSQSAESSRDVLRNLSAQLRAQVYSQYVLADQNLLSIQGQFAHVQQEALAAQQREQLSTQLRSLQILTAAQGEQLSNLLNVQMAVNNRAVEKEKAFYKASTFNDFYIPGLGL